MENKMTRKPFILAAVLSASLIPLSAFAWHGGYWDDHPGPGWHHRYDGPHGGYWCDGPRVGPKHRLAPRAPMRHGVQTFGMDREQAVAFINEVGAVLGITSGQQKVWQQLQKAYGDLAQVRFEHRRAFDPAMTRQARLEARSHFMTQHAKAFDSYVKVRAELQKTLGNEKMVEFDHLINTASLLQPPQPPQKAGERPQPPRP